MSRNPEPHDNHLLAALSPEVQNRLFTHLQMVPLQLRSIMYEPNRPVRDVYFPTNSIVSLQYLLENGSSTALSVVGNEGLIGVNWFLAEESAPSRALVQSAGYAYRLPKARVKEEFDRHGELMLLMLRYTQVMITQISQTAVCNRHHTIVQQLCRWLLITLDRVSETRLTMTHEFISNMLGVRRESVSEAASNLQKLDVISYSRGLINVIDRKKLETLACECYSAVKTESDLLLDYLPQRQVIKDTGSIPERRLKITR